MLKRLSVLWACLLCVTVLSAQKVDKTVTRSIEKFFTEYTSENIRLKNCNLERRRNNIIVNKGARKVIIYANQNFAAQVFTPEVVENVYNGIRKVLPASLAKYKIEVIAGRKPIEELVPNNLRKGKTDKSRLWGKVEYDGAPWVENLSKPYKVKHGLAGRHLALWQSHGRIYSADKGMWQWQRPSLYCTTEDLFTQSVVVPFLLPMLQNAGALVYTPRERDWQRECVVVDNDTLFGASSYVQEAQKRREWVALEGGFKPREAFYVDGENPFTHGTAVAVSSSQGAKKSGAVARWQPDIPVDGMYAVYVSYKTVENSVPDARYSVLHCGGVTDFKVNQQMGGGTWVYLGTFRFRAGAHENQGVVLTNTSDYEGVVTADAVRFGGGMGLVARGDSLPQTSGFPRYLEGARYALQYSGFPYEVYTPSNGEIDYNDDINCRSHAVNHLSGGSVYNPDTLGLNVPLELSFGFHSDAGISAEDDVIGTLGVVTTEYSGDTLAVGLSRYASRDVVSNLLLDVQRDLSARYGFCWPVRGILDKSYSESRLPVVPSLIFESLSHQNYKDMAYGHNPDFKFTLARAVYKSLLKQVCYMHGRDFVVQPLPVRCFSLSLDEKQENVLLRWKAVEDELELSATPDSYIIYTKINDGDFDNGRVVDKCSFEMPILENVLYSFKVAALNDGGESFPSEVLSAYVAGKEKGRALIVNGFHRLSGPREVCTASKAGFDMDGDPGVAYMNTAEYGGRQLDYERSNIGYEDGLGLSGNDFEGMLIAGNSFDYPFVHGKAMAANGVTFVSCSSEAVMEGEVLLTGFDVVDYIAGVEKQGESGSLLGYNHPYKTFPLEIQNKIAGYLAAGGRLFVSGAHIASDMSKNEEDKRFVRELLKFEYGGSVSDVSENVIFGSNLSLPVYRTVNEHCYAVSRPDVLVPAKDAFVAFVFNRNKKSAGVAYAGRYRVLSTSFPFESVEGDMLRSYLMGAVLRFLLK